MIGSAIPLILSYMLGYVEDSFAVFDALSFSCLLLATFAVSAVFSKWLMFSSVLIITALSSCLLLINHEYFLMYESYISKSTLPLLNDLLYALKHFITGSILVPLLLSVAFIVGLIFVFRKHSADLPKLLSLGVAFTALLLYFGSANIHAQRYEIQRLLLKGDKYDFKFDVIILTHIIEHIQKSKIITTLTFIKNEFLSENGKLLIAVPNAQSNTDCYWAYEDWTHTTLFTSGSIYYVLKAAGFDKIEFLDIDCTLGSSKIKSTVRKFFLMLYASNKKFWNKITHSAFHQQSPQIFSYEIKVKAK